MIHGTIGADAVARAPADGHTRLVNASTFVSRFLALVLATPGSYGSAQRQPNH